MKRVLILAAFAVAVSATPAPRPYNQGPEVRFIAAKPVAVSGLFDDSVALVGQYALKAEGTDALLGLSDLRVTVDGEGYRLEALSDFAWVWRFRFDQSLKSPLLGGILRDETSAEIARRDDADSEDWAFDEKGRAYVAFERKTRILSYDSLQHSAQRPTLKGLKPLPHNEGIESLAFVYGAKDENKLLLGIEAGGFYLCDKGAALVCRPVAADPAPEFGYRIVSLEGLGKPEKGEESEVLALYRYFDPLTGPRNIVRLMVWDGQRLRRKATLAKIAPPLEIANFEGISAVKTATGYRLFLISDQIKDNELPRMLVLDWIRKNPAI